MQQLRNVLMLIMMSSAIANKRVKNPNIERDIDKNIKINYKVITVGKSPLDGYLPDISTI